VRSKQEWTVITAGFTTGKRKKRVAGILRFSTFQSHVL
jgi:hypothetical protein